MRPIAFIVAVLLAAGSAFASVDRLVIHEWGTFTSLQDEDGRSIGAINSDDERLPPFVHDLIQSEFQYYKGGVPDSFPSVTMRLETPVLYIHPAPGMKVPPLDVTVHFRGGLLTQFYPLAAASRPRFTNAQLDPITADTDGRLAWAHLTVGGDAAGPATDAHVWTAPRDVAGIANFSANGESEKFLFYRGVGHLDAPVRVVRHSNLLMFQNQVEFPLVGRAPLRIGAAWFAQFDDSGHCAWRAVDLSEIEPIQAQSLMTAATFRPEELSSKRLAELKTAMHAALVSDGLFDDEATAMLRTWELSYFKSAGTRLFLLVPREWTDHYLPLSVSADADITRVMMGRIDLVTPAMREQVRQFIAMDDKKDPTANDAAYRRLGRFRRALVLDERSRRPAGAVAKN